MHFGRIRVCVLALASVGLGCSALESAAGDRAESGGASGKADGESVPLRYETNHGASLLHHNKYLILRGVEGGDEVLCGAANLTGAGFTTNFENIYYLSIPSVVAQLETQFARVWEGERAPGDDQDPPVATPRNQMPAENLLP